jgi:sigma-70-like protein
MEGTRPTAGEGRIVDPADFDAAFQQHFPQVYRFIARRVGPALAEDLAAETFATAYRRRASFEPGRASLRSWLYGIAANLVRNHWRAEQHLLALDARLVPEVDASGSLRHELSCGEFTKAGPHRIGRIDAVELTGNGGREMFWVNPRTYLPVRVIFTTTSGARLQTDFGWFAPTKARLAELHLAVPPGFRQVRAP